MTDKKIVMPLEEIMGERFGRYSKYIIQDRALPDVRDGLKPVQRRILYAMFKEGNTYNHPYRKSAKTVGNVIGNYHPHGDSSVYDAMVRLSQEWKMRVPLVDMQGNNGSIDNDPAAAMRYTEARLSKIALELLRDLDKDTCNMALNFDDTEYEPTVLPAKFPNLLVNGATGISAGYATDIPPHNLHEVIDATIYRIKHPHSSLDQIMELMPGPDFPTGGIVEGKEGIREAFETGRGKVIVRSLCEIVESKNMNQIIITEIPYEVNKADLVRRMDEIRFNRAVDGIIEVRDESDRNGLRIVVDLKKEALASNILNYFYKNTDLQKNYNYNMVAISDKRPMQMGVLPILDAYIGHQIEVVTRRTLFDLDKARNRLHIVDGLMKAISILDEVVATIRHSKDKADAKNNLMAKYGFTEKQAEAIVMLQLYRLTNTDIVTLQEEKKELDLLCVKLEAILEDDKVLRKVICDELKEVKALYTSPRLSKIEEEVLDVSIDKQAMIIAEDVIVSVTRDGYVKRISERSYKSADKASYKMKDDDYLLHVTKCNTLDKLLIFTSKGNYLYVPVNELEEFKWRDLGKHISYMVKTDSDEKMIDCIVVRDFREDLYVLMGSRSGQVKRTALNEFELLRYNKAVKCMNLKGDDELCYVTLCHEGQAVFMTTRLGKYNLFDMSELSPLGIKAGGVKGIDIKEGNALTSLKAMDINGKQELLILSEQGSCKHLKITDLQTTKRASVGLMCYKNAKSHPSTIKGVVYGDIDQEITLYFEQSDPLTTTMKTIRRSNLDAKMTALENVSGALQFIYIEECQHASIYDGQTFTSKMNEEVREVKFERLQFDI